MKKEILFELKSPYRDSFKIYGYRFGEGEHTVAIVGAIRGDEIQQQFICSQLVKNLIDLEKNNLILPNHQILVIPSVNPFSMNIHKRFWAMDNTDINRMFPGYDKGETTQRIAAALFEQVKGYQYGIQFPSFYIRGEFIPHIRILDTGHQDTESAKCFGLPYIMLRKPSSFDTTLLNYNWQIWETQAYSIYSSATEQIDKDSAKLAWVATLRFFAKKGIIQYSGHSGFISSVIDEESMANVVSENGGFFYPKVTVGQDVRKGDLLAKILDPYDGSVLSELTAPVSGVVFFAHKQPIVSQNTMLYRVL
ncbi:hypothetical protein AGMMS49938_07950 [Fibrobacterales bacterium]|nr:hypothetical protein AGMMS49938_07950 [Fibrobacterales bacterium]